MIESSPDLNLDSDLLAKLLSREKDEGFLKGGADMSAPFPMEAARRGEMGAIHAWNSVQVSIRARRCPDEDDRELERTRTVRGSSEHSRSLHTQRLDRIRETRPRCMSFKKHMDTFVGGRLGRLRRSTSTWERTRSTPASVSTSGAGSGAGKASALECCCFFVRVLCEASRGRLLDVRTTRRRKRLSASGASAGVLKRRVCRRERQGLKAIERRARRPLQLASAEGDHVAARCVLQRLNSQVYD